MSTASFGEPIFGCEAIGLSLGGRQIIDDLSLSVAPHEILGVIGPNGAGKTSLFEVLSGRYRPQRGRVRLRGQDITALPIHRRARLGIARTYQSPVVPTALTVAEVLKAAREAFPPWLTRHHAEWACHLVGLKVPEDTPAGALETLNRRKLLLACLLMRRPAVVLMDEPAAGLINSEIDEVDAIVRVLAKEMGMAVIVVEHRLELLAAIADRIAVMDLGRKIAEGVPEHVFEDPAVRAAYFDVAA
ncbi:MAG: ABC transporter ATP-binding protein [Betaproteobacteria bacterium]|jgi:branched-chain amino acid transport system ATP-binding protein|nr:ABC transporter ATP-binding protein [Rhodocyclaceae bacterium]MCA3136252.1 ABC transporter ATP-binding protein [Rhodocyclaceae bacterium]MCA3143882.1 ABC transporter ATP-binding protein [Rhodocyclaceae bacterium]MCA3146638.1 ABC transporter ATP-binding protein [Rhodocyclaceae bacterium]MCE2899219.1 ATP-binding cassette domain-containing protein [Betaproteobacteria bacterium]